MGAELDSQFQPGQHIPGLNVGGWFDAGDYDNIASSQYEVIQNLSLAYKEFDLKWDELSVDEDSRTVEMHRPDGVPDAVEQVKHGVLQILAQINSVGHPFQGIIEPTLREYTHLGDAASQTDGRIYSDKLGPHEVDGNFSGVPDDRWAFTTKRGNLQYGAAASLAAASGALKGWDDTLSEKCLDAAEKLWADERAHPTPNRGGGAGGFGFGGPGGANSLPTLEAARPVLERKAESSRRAHRLPSVPALPAAALVAVASARSTSGRQLWNCWSRPMVATSIRSG